MSRTWRIYYNIVFGGLGGLIAWILVGSLPNVTTNDLAWELIIGAVAGMCIGGALGGVDGAFSRHWLQLILGMLRGAGVGMVGGMVGLAIGEGLFLLTQGGLAGRSIGWALVGAIIGSTEGIVNRARRKISYGVLGGTLGGLIGGALIETLTEFVLNVGVSPDLESQIQNAAAAIGLVVVGACIGSLIALVERILVDAYFHVVRGPREGMDFSVIKPVMTIGNDNRNDISLYDSSVGARFALVRQRNKRVMLENDRGIVKMTRRGSGKDEAFAVSSPIILEDGDLLQIGNSQLRFHQRGPSR
ncbi:MAG: FHA domain-containing protein [Anaerolineae bacterium]